MADFRHIQHVALWLGGLATLAPNAPKGNDLKVALGKYAQLLAGEFPAEAFSPDSEAAIAAKLEFWPSYGKLYELVRAWWREHRPPLTAITKARPAEELTLRDAELSREWDDPIGIAKRVRAADGDERWLRFLAGAVMKYAPQHIGLLPVEAQRAAALPLDAGAASTDIKPKAHHMTPAQLLATFEQMGQGGSLRAQMVRRQLGQ